MSASPETKRPNIMLLIAEDTGRHQGCYGDDYAWTPNLDRLAADGCRYTNAITHSPVCAPSRSGLVTGMYPWTFGTHPMRSTLINPPRLFTQELQDAGYFVNWKTKTDFNFEPPADFASTDESWFEKGELPGGDRPFFVCHNFGITHESGAWDVCNDHQMTPFEQRTASLPDEHRHDPAEAPVPPYLPDTPDVRMEIARYYDNLSVQDQQIGRALRILEESGRAQNTIVIYLSDHGRGLCREKRWCYEAGIHLPLIIRWPATPAPGSSPPPLKPGTTDDQLVAWVDLAPTILSLCGVGIPEHYQGRVFLGEGVSTPPRQYAYDGRDRMDEQFDRIRVCRSKQYHYIRNFYPLIPYMQRNKYMENGLTTRALREGRAENTLTPIQAQWMADRKPVEEMYDVEADPHCVNDLANEPKHRDTLLEHRHELQRFLDELGDLGATPEAELIRRGLLTNRLEEEYRPRIAPLPDRYRIGRGDTVLTGEEAVERYGPMPTPES